MRRFGILVLILVLLTGCATPVSDQQENIERNFYYCVEGTEQLTTPLTIQPEQRQGAFFTLGQLMEEYLKGPTTDHLRTPFPQGTEMLALREGKEGLEITMSGGFFTLQGVELSIEAYCLAKTVCEYLSIDHITVVDETGSIHMEIAPDNFLLENSFRWENESVFTLYFPDTDHRYLIPETRTVTLSENEAPESYLLRQLLQGPKETSLTSPFPQETELLGVYTNGGICTVDLSSHFFTDLQDDSYGIYTAIYSVVNTLTGLDEINGVQFLKQGELVEKYGVFSLREPVSRYSGSVGLIRASGTELDINVYVLENNGDGAFGVPVRVKQTIAQPLAEAVAQAAIQFEAPQGFYNPIPYGTELLGISMSGNVCYVDVSRSFIPTDGTERSERAAVWALVSALTNQDSIRSVVLTIEGDSSGLAFVDISQPLTAENIILG